MYSYEATEIITLANGISLSDFAEDSFIEINPVEEKIWETVTGADGISSRVRSGNNNYIAKLVFKQGSTSAKMLKNMSKLPNNTDIFNFTLQDPASKDEFLNSSKSFVQNRPGATRGKSLGTITIEIMLINPVNNFS